jgi:peptidoglycan biosynthesis protein MviN/MurJ (putative lipid II flippase)
MNKHVFVLEIDIQIPRHIFIIWLFYQGLPQLARHHEEGPGDEVGNTQTRGSIETATPEVSLLP